MSFSLSITEADICTALGNFLAVVLPAGTQIVRGQANRVSIPKAPAWVVMTPVLKARLATNIDTWAGAEPVSESLLTYMQADVQVDCYGPGAHDMAQVILTTFRDDFACQQLASSGLDITPLYTSDPRNVPFVNDQDQYEDRWSLDCAMQVNPVVQAPQQFADVVTADLISVEERYPPNGA